MALVISLGQQGKLPYEHIGFDSLGDFDRLCDEEVCVSKFNKNWGDNGFMSFHKGFEVAAREWSLFLQALDRLQKNGTSIVLLGHLKIESIENPGQPNFSQYQIALQKKKWELTGPWLDNIWSGGFIAITDKIDGKMKGIGTGERALYTQHSDARVAKNRYGMPPEIEMPEDPSQTWGTVMHYIHHD